jgi:hypothetical protein
LVMTSARNIPNRLPAASVPVSLTGSLPNPPRNHGASAISTPATSSARLATSGSLKKSNPQRTARRRHG